MHGGLCKGLCVWLLGVVLLGREGHSLDECSLLGVISHQFKHIPFQVVKLALVLEHLDNVVLFLLSALTIHRARVLSAHASALSCQLTHFSLFLLNSSLLVLQVALGIPDLSLHGG